MDFLVILGSNAAAHREHRGRGRAAQGRQDTKESGRRGRRDAPVRRAARAVAAAKSEHLQGRGLPA